MFILSEPDTPSACSGVVHSRNFLFAWPRLIHAVRGETSNWCFGNGAGTTFNDDGTVSANTNGRLNTFEGCTTISDPAGDLLFYTDGITVYNQDHVVMENGNGLFGDSSSTQSAIIIPKPDDPDIYYIFMGDTSIAENDVDRGLNYSEVDISLNGGNGAIVQRIYHY
ncbi:hypothetical protein MNBD_BACTEROID03-1338 [hydrothermal vent metagenome]|uniref:Uncharacterized protein n=1 Tax=hydrothermal vent metagenome TaxID=652676 RepID=A0A3B0T5R7_9ZZZZ